MSFSGFFARQRNTEKPQGLFHTALATEAFPDIDAALSDYDQGKYCFSVTGGGGGPLDSSFYGETCIPEVYARNHWSGFEFVDNQEAGKKLLQDVYCVRKTA